MTISASEIHRRAVVVDGHCDTPYRLLRHNLHFDEHDTEAQLDLRSLEDSGITATFFAAYVPPFYAGRGAADFARRVIALIMSEIKRRPDRLRLVTDCAGIPRVKQEANIGIMIGVEGGHAIEDSLEILRELYAKGARYMTLTHVNTNNWCDSSGDGGRHDGLTDFGRQVVGTMNDIGMIVDISHVSDKAFYAVLETTRVPVVATHSSCRALCRHPRNLTDDMLRDLARNGGVCMINFFSAFVNDQVAQVVMHAQKRPRGNGGTGGTEEMPDDRTDWDSYLEWFKTLGCPIARFDDVIDHIVHAATVAGIDHVGLGSDFDGVPALPRGLETASGVPQITERLLARGFSEEDVTKILGANFLRVFERIEAGRRS
ncbi:MAG TPA: dipeptidase [Thermoanaerobaculia bacterium]|nr:dipeptidase [Thermoanaerobaculia bacterium]